MTDHEFDHALVAAFLAEAGERGWRAASVAAAARRAGLPLARARSRFPVRLVVLMRLGEQADRAALEGAGAESEAATPLPARELLFDMLMRRLDVLQENRAGVLALFASLPFDPGAALALAGATGRSMAWMLAGAGVETTGFGGVLRINLLSGAWLYAVRAWQADESADLSGAMAALDRALDRIGGFDGVFARPTTDGSTGGGPMAEPPPADETFSPS